MINEKLYPPLPEKAKEEYQKLIDSFKDEIKVTAKKVISDLYCDVGTHIEEDSWYNFRNTLMDGLKGYPSCLKYDFKKVREEILKENREEIVKDLNQDLVEEVESLKRQLKTAYECNSRF